MDNMKFADNGFSNTQDISVDTLSTRLAGYNNVIGNFTTLSQAIKLQEVITKDHKETEKKLKQFFDDSNLKHNQDLRSLELKRTSLTSTLSNFHSSLEQLSKSTELATSICTKVNRVERERDLVEQTLKYIEQCYKLKSNISLVHDALESKNYKLAADAIEEIRLLPSSIFNSAFTNKVVPSSNIPELPSQLLETWTSKLSKIFHDEFFNAAKNNDIGQVTSWFQLFPKIGYSELGVEVYSKYVCNIIADQGRKIMMGQTEKPPMFFCQVLLHLFKMVSTIINDHSKVIAKCYGLQHMTHIMRKVQREADLQAGLVWDTFMETRRIEAMIKELNAWEDNQKQQGGQTAVADYTAPQLPYTINELSLLINEFSSILQNWSMYCRFFTLKWCEFSNNDTSNLEIPDPIAKGAFNHKVTQSLYLFEVLVKYHLHGSFLRALELEELPSLDQFLINADYTHDDLTSYPISTLLEDLVLVIRANLIANVNTGETKVLSHFINSLMKFIQSEYLIKVQQTRLKVILPRLNYSLVLKKYQPPPSDQTANLSRSVSPAPQGNEPGSKLSHFGFNFKSAATSTLTNLQSNLQSVYTDEESVLKLHECLIYINTLAVGEEYFRRILIKEIIEDQPVLLQNNFPFRDDAKQMQEALQWLYKSLKTQNGKLLQWAITQLFENMMQGKLKKMMAPLFTNGSEQNYICSSNDFENISNLNAFVKQWTNLTRPFYNVIYKPAYIEFISLMVDFLCQLLEDKIWLIECNELGALKLDRELGLFISTLCGHHYFLKDKFTRLSQVVLIVGLDNEDFDPSSNDINEQTLSSINWMLNSQERIKARNLRVDKRV
ncbi:HBL080Cp [Eremothecium sinecaudum]|uniref:Conserved oligomeric Golgi complex subunit 4 n=1 Tax=Eremothecium sinecaudum TaxID=45286 RepID=A0A109UWX2_9SACH|nr:HBL080Cp [Eremothecium sinecaudum]AMD18822.1 HBL080Cp [Eremothecium sinecaudum]